MALTAQLGVVDAKPINLELGRNAVIQPFTTATPASLVVEVAFAADPVSSAGYYFNDLNDGPTGYWRMDNQTTLTDQTGSGNNMTVEGTPTLTTTLIPGDGNQATIFNGTSQDAYAVNSSGLSPTTAMTLECWIKTPSSFAGSTVDIVQKRGMYRLQLTSTGNVVFQVKNGTNNPSVTSNITLATSTTYHLACVYDGAHLLLYINGAFNAQNGYSLNLEPVASRLKIGGGDNGSSSPAYGTNAFAGTPAGQNLTVNKPASTADGDYLIAEILYSTFAQMPNLSSAPAGWTLLGMVRQADSELRAYGKIASGEPANYTWSIDGKANMLGSISRYTGVSSVVPVGSVTTNTTTSGTTVVGNALPAYDNTMLVSLFGARVNGFGTWSESAGTEQLDYNPSGTSAIAINTLAVGSSSTQTNTGTLSLTGELNVIQVELVGTLSSTYTAITVDEVSLFGYALTADQVLDHYNQAVNPPPTITWTDISADVKQVQITRGRQYELNRIEAGTASLVLNDDLRKYDPANTSSPYAPNIIPMRQIRIRALFNSTYYPLFQGYIERWESHWESGWGGVHAECDVTAVDGFEPLSLTALAGNTQMSLSGTTIANLLGNANWSATARNLDAGAFSTQAFTRDTTTSILEYIQQVADGEAGLFFIDASGNAVFHDKNHRTSNTRSTTSQGTFGDQSLIALPYTALAPSKDKDHIINDWTVNDSTGTAHQAQDTTSQTKFFHRTGSRSTFLSAADATTMANYLLSVTSSPGYRFNEIELCPNTNSPLWLQALQREISDRVTVQRQPVGITPGSQIVVDCWIEAVKWTITPQAPWRVQWQLSPAT